MFNSWSHKSPHKFAIRPVSALFEQKVITEIFSVYTLFDRTHCIIYVLRKSCTLRRHFWTFYDWDFYFQIFVVQHVDVCMFSNGKFKNIVSLLNAKQDCPIHSGGSLDRTYRLIPIKGTTKNWIALEESYSKNGTSLASTVTSTVS